MRISVAFGFLLAVALLGGFLVSRASSAAKQQPDGPYAPMAVMSNDPTAGGYRVKLGNGIKDNTGRQVFPTDSAGNLELAVQYQVKLPVHYPPGGVICRLVVQGVKIPGCCGDEWKFDSELPLEPFLVRGGEHVNDVVVVRIPRPPDSKSGGVRVVLEVLGDDDEWESRSVRTERVTSL